MAPGLVAIGWLKEIGVVTKPIDKNPSGYGVWSLGVPSAQLQVHLKTSFRIQPQVFSQL